MLYFAGIIITFFLAFILISKKDKSEADKILGAWLILIGLHLITFYLHTSNKYLQFPYLLGFELPLPLIHGPFLYLYCASLTKQHYKKGLRFLHFLPFVLGYLPFTKFFLLPVAHKISVYQNNGAGYAETLLVMYVLISISGIAYILLSLQLLNRHKKNIVNQFSYTEKINLTWLRYLVLGLIVIWFAVIFGNDVSVFTSVVLFIIFIGYFGIKQMGIFTHTAPSIGDLEEAESDKIVPPTPLDGITIEKYTKSGLDNDTANKIHQQLTGVMQSNGLYKNPELSLGKLSQELSVPPNQLSQVINSKEQKSFYDYINHLRVDAFKQLVAQPENQKFTLLALAYECGFNSKASFNRNFKKVTGLSPTEYLKSINIMLTEK